ncbi:MAG: tetratricopeptide repeat protein, partial [Pseudomonadota bacterium]
ALLDLRRVDEAIAALDAAEKYAVGTHAYVNFAINLGVAQERVARADAALATFAKVVGTSEHGGLILQVGIANAALQTGDLPRANEAMLRAREARWTGVRLYTRALLRAGRVDEARELMLELLRNPNWRGQMLADVQNYRTLPPLPAERDEFARFKALVNLPEVHQAILEVGHIENFDFPHP